MQLVVREVSQENNTNVLMKLTANEPLPQMFPGQFAQLKVENSPSTYLRRPISINFFDEEKNEVWFLISAVGAGTRALSSLKKGDTLDCLLPLGNSFSLPEDKNARILLVGGGVGVAPMYFLGTQLVALGYKPEFLLGARRADLLCETKLFEAVAPLHISTEDGSLGEKGLVTSHSILSNTNNFTHIYTCGPKPMMVAVAHLAKKRSVFCEVSLENLMACGLGACLCCVENTVKGNICVCKEGPVMNINQLLWQI